MIRSLIPLVLAGTVCAVEIVNGDMAQGDTTPTGWTAIWTPDESIPVAAARDTAVFKSAPASLRFDNPQGAPFANVSVKLTVKGGENLKIGAGMRIGTGVKRGTFALQCHDAAGTQTVWQEIVGGEPGETWKTGLVRAPIPAGTATATLVLLMDGKGSVWLDDVTIDEQP